MTINDKLEIMGQTPDILNELLDEVPDYILKTRRIKNKWSIHEHVCHLYESQKMMIKRFRVFKSTNNPKFVPYLPGSPETPDNNLQKMDMQMCKTGFKKDRNELITFLQTFTEVDWENRGGHPEYKVFTPAIFLRHIMMHDHFHMYRIEELWLTSEEFLPK